MTIRGALFDFSGTLFRLEFDADDLRALTDSVDPSWDEETQQRLLTLLTAPADPSEHLPPDLLADWERRDLDPTLHRHVNIAALRGSGLVADGAAEACYQMLLYPSSWKPYPDTLSVLADLRAAGVPVAVVSNIAWDIREVFDRYGAAGYVDEFVLSYQEQVMKPDPAIFTAACERLGVAPHETVMVGDSRYADGGAAGIGCAVEIVDPLPTAERPSALRRAIGAAVPSRA